MNFRGEKSYIFAGKRNFKNAPPPQNYHCPNRSFSPTGAWDAYCGRLARHSATENPREATAAEKWYFDLLRFRPIPQPVFQSVHFRLSSAASTGACRGWSSCSSTSPLWKLRFWTEFQNFTSLMDRILKPIRFGFSLNYLFVSFSSSKTNFHEKLKILRQIASKIPDSLQIENAVEGSYRDLRDDILQRRVVQKLHFSLFSEN